MSRLILTAALVTTLAACGADAESHEDADSQPVPAASATQPAASAAQPAASAPARSIPAGTVLTFEVRENVSTSSHSAGDAFSLVLVDGATGQGGAALNAGTSARGVVTDVHKSTGPDDDAVLAVRITSVEAGGAQRPVEAVVQSTEIESSTQDSGTRTAVKIATGTAAGALVGQLLGGNTRSTVQGAAAGTVVGTVVALSTRGGDATLTNGSRITVRLDRALTY